MDRKTSLRFQPLIEDERELDEDVILSQPQSPCDRELPVITKLNVMYTPLAEMEPSDTLNTSLPTNKEPPKLPDLSCHRLSKQLLENPRALLLLLHQKELEIKGLKYAAHNATSKRIGYILQEIVKPRQKGEPGKNIPKMTLQKEVDQLNEELKVTKEGHQKELKQLEDKLVKSKLSILHLQEAVKSIVTTSAEELDTDSSLSLDEVRKIACEGFQFWPEMGNRTDSENSDLRLRRIPKRTSFVDAFHKFGGPALSDEDKKELILKLEAVAQQAGFDSITDESPPESSGTESQLPSEQSSSAFLASQKSDITSSTTETKITESSLSAPSFIGKNQQEKNIPVTDSWHLTQAGLSRGRSLDGRKSTGSIPSMEICKRLQPVTGSLKIVSVHRKGKFVRILNTLLNKEADLSGYIIRQWVGGYPVSTYRFPSGTILPAQHHITVWAAAANLFHEKPSDPLPGPRFFRAGPECVTVLYDYRGQTMSQHTNPHQFTAAAEAYSDNVDLSVDKFPLNEDDDEDNEDEDSSRITLSFDKQHRSKGADPGILIKRRYSRHFSIDASAANKTPTNRSTVAKAKIIDPNKVPSDSFLFSSKPPSHSGSESPSSSSEGDYFAYRSWKPLVQEPEARAFKTTLDTTLPIVSLIGQKSARSKYGFKHMTYIPTTTDLHLRRYCPAK